MHPSLRNLILAPAPADGGVRVATLAQHLNVAPETFRRDLAALQHWQVRRVRGGAMLVERRGSEPGLSDREGVLADEKDRIAKAALDELPADGAIIIDAGTTTVRLAEMLPTDRALTVVTHSLPVAVVLAGRPNVTLHFVGGIIRELTLAAVGDWALKNLADIHPEVAFVGANGLSLEQGLTTPDLAEAAVKRAMIGAAGRTVVLAHHTKIGRVDFVHVAPLSAIDVLITDSGVDHSTADEIEAAGPQLVRS